MTVELGRLLLGVLIAVFHRPLSARIMEQERALDAYLRSRGMRFPNYLRSRGMRFPKPLSDTSAQNLYFLIGIFICLLQAGRIWLAIHG